jgi:hypothetical protein
LTVVVMVANATEAVTAITNVAKPVMIHSRFMFGSLPFVCAQPG